MKKTLKERIENGTYTDSVLNYDSKRFEKYCFGSIYKNASSEHIRKRAKSDSDKGKFRPSVKEGEYFHLYRVTYYSRTLIRFADKVVKWFVKL